MIVLFQIILNFRLSAYTRMTHACGMSALKNTSKAVYKCMNEKFLWTFDIEVAWTFDVERTNLRRCSIYISIYILIDIFSSFCAVTILYEFYGGGKEKKRQIYMDCTWRINEGAKQCTINVIFVRVTLNFVPLVLKYYTSWEFLLHTLITQMYYFPSSNNSYTFSST